MSKTVIQVENLSKLYRLGEVGTGTISHDLHRWWAKMRKKEDPYAKIGEVNDRAKRGSSDYVWALKDLNFEVKEGQVLGIIGRNGAGKSTLLKLLSRVTKPTSGQIKVRGRIAALLEVGTGFHPELTGRENIYLNGAILGMSKVEIQRKFDEIVDFSGVERYIDTPVKRYSSGMYVRLAFAVAAFLEPEILIVDEVLAVGDAEFQKKCLGRMKDVSVNDGRTVLFVSHNMPAVRALCNECALIVNGQITIKDETSRVLREYFNEEINEIGEFEIRRSFGFEDVVVEKVRLYNSKSEMTATFSYGEKMTVELELHAKSRIEKPYIWMCISSDSGPITFASGMMDGFRTLFLDEGKNVVRCTFQYLPLLPNKTYTVHVGIRGSDGQTFLTQSKDVAYFKIHSILSEIGFNNVLSDQVADSMHAQLIPYEWEFNDGKSYQFELLNYVR